MSTNAKTAAPILPGVAVLAALVLGFAQPAPAAITQNGTSIDGLAASAPATTDAAADAGEAGPSFDELPLDIDSVLQRKSGGRKSGGRAERSPTGAGKAEALAFSWGL